MLTFIIFSAIIGISKAQLDFKDCGSKNGAVKSIEVEGCTETPCKLIRGKNANVKIKFIPTISTITLRPRFTATVSGFSLNFSLDENDGCLLGASCPADRNVENQIEFSVPILNSFPIVKGQIKMRIVGDRNINIVCIEMPMQTSN
ncbi:epididymal secretory E1 [Brachionus plicatilis]|uniref:Epididymal secretory E1 n=1 Tax=Brachionus plicatilis TaxID=10195 RepID=A0A3M7S8D4_BRAPC|nr:epididymal secretory E1 [Brachionus plicatilis]